MQWLIQDLPTGGTDHGQRKKRAYNGVWGGSPGGVQGRGGEGHAESFLTPPFS